MATAVVVIEGPSHTFPRKSIHTEISPLRSPGPGALQIPPAGRDDKARVITHLKVCESDREILFAIRLAEL
jgi:hypothetical protein